MSYLVSSVNELKGKVNLEFPETDNFGSLVLERKLPFNDATVIGPTLTQWYGIAISYDGQYISALPISGRIQVSSNYGDSFTQRESNRSWGLNGMSMSYSGQYQLAAEQNINSRVFKSSNYGVTWTPVAESQGPAPMGHFWMATGISGNGQYQVAGSANFGSMTSKMIISSDYGATFNSIPFWDNEGVGAIRVSETGQYILAAPAFSAYDGNLMFSDDYGATWGSIFTAYSGKVGAIAMSGDGQYIVAAIENGPIINSFNGGKTWKYTPMIRPGWWGAAMSSGGRIQMLVSPVGGHSAVVSTDYGQTWKELAGLTLEEEEYTQVGMSGNGQLIVAGQWKSDDQSRMFRTRDWLAGDFGDIVKDQTKVAAKPLSFGPTADRPIKRYITMEYFDTDLGYMIWWNGVNWVDASGTIV